MPKKWITVNLADGTKQIKTLDENGNCEIEFSQPTEIVAVIVSDAPESRIADAFTQAADS